MARSAGAGRGVNAGAQRGNAQQRGGRGRGRGQPSVGPGSGIVETINITAKNAAGTPVAKEAFLPNTLQPQYLDRNLTEISGSRHARRPSALARKLGKRSAGEAFDSDTFDGADDDWSTTEPMPYEMQEQDCGWTPGPCVRQQPDFLGPKPGPTDPSLVATSPARAFFDSQVSQEWKEKWAQYTQQHAQAYRTANPAWRKSCVERCFSRLRVITPKVFDVWVAAKLRVAQLKPEIPAAWLWSQKCSLYDAQLASMITFHQYCFINRHASFASYTAGTQGTRGEENYDNEELLSSAISLRRKRSACNHVLLSPAEGLAGGEARRGVGSHVLVDMGALAAEERKRKAVGQNRSVDDIKRVNTCRGICKYSACTIVGPGKRVQYRCSACEKYYHLSCFFKCHQCTAM
jgi:hypothetical protein